MSGTSAKSKPVLRVAWADAKAAHFACTRWHYSRSLPPGVALYVGVWEDDAFVGVVVFTRGANRNLASSWALAATECCELVRVALTAHKTPVTRILRFAMQLLTRRCPGIRLVISFADANQGHHGGIYQGGGWIYTGMTPGSHAYVDATGRQWHQRQVSASGFVTEFGQRRRCKKKSEVRQVELLGKHRYLMPLDAALARSLKERAKPYPKREQPAKVAQSAQCSDTAQRVEGVASTGGVQPSGDGWQDPISALQQRQS